MNAVATQAGVMVGPRRRCHMSQKKGWARACFAVERHALEEASGRMERTTTPDRQPDSARLPKLPGTL